MSNPELPTEKPSSPNNEAEGQEIIRNAEVMAPNGTANKVGMVIETVSSKTISGPIPSPEALQQYETICPGAADRIISMAEKNMAHRHSMEEELLSSEFKLRKTGQLYGLIALILLLSVVAFTFYLKMPISAGILGSVTILSVVAMFLNRESVPSAKSTPDEPKQDDA
jgi:uncharacterized membrane protein